MEEFQALISSNTREQVSKSTSEQKDLFFDIKFINIALS